MTKFIWSLLHSGHHFPDEEAHNRYKFIFVNLVCSFECLVSFVMGFVRLGEGNFTLGLIDLVIAGLIFSILIYLRKSKKSIDKNSEFIIVLSYVLFFAIYLLAPTQHTRFGLFFLLLATVFFLKGKREGAMWLSIIVLSVLAVHFFLPINTGYTNLDIALGLIFLTALFFIMNVYHLIMDSHNKILRNVNVELEHKVAQRTKMLEIVNEELAKEKELLKIMSRTDQLTGLYNRYKLEEAFDYEKNQSERYKTVLSVILIDLDHFKSVNDNFGHNVGDIFLQETAQFIERTLRQSDVIGRWECDVIGRWGGEEFLILTPKTDLEKTSDTAERIRIAFEEHEFSIVGRRTASFGVTTLTKEDNSLSDLVKRADEALYLAKKEGRNCVKTVG